MKKNILIIAAVFQFILMGCGNTMNIEVSGSTDRLPELVEIELSQVQNELDLKEGETFIIKQGNDTIPYQITYNKKVVFPAKVQADKKLSFEFSKGTPAETTVKVCGAHYPERVDDICWENDLVGFRVYGFKEDKPSGYDLFTKKNSDLPVIPEMYRLAFDPEILNKLKELEKTDKDAAHRFDCDHRSFHVDHGYGADCYAVGPTLGAGVAALVDSENIIYPACYDSFEILDNGPLRFTLKLTFKPKTIGDCENIVETRIITLDLGSHFNKTTVKYENLDKAMPIVAGIVLQDKEEKAVADIEKGFVAYPAPTMNADKQQNIDNGTIFIANVFPQQLDKAGIDYFSDEESIARGGAKGHVLAHSTYEPGSEFTYYWGFGWDKSNMETYEQWLSYTEQFAAQIKEPVKAEPKKSNIIESIFSYIIGLGAAVMMPIIFTILGLCIGIGLTKSLKSGLLVGVGFVGLSVITSLLTSTLGPALGDVVENYGLQLKVFDMGWPAAASVAYNTSVGAFIIPVCLGVNLLMLLTKTTRTVNIDLWNYWHFAFIGAIVYFASGSIFWGFFAAIVCYIITLILADYTADRFQGFYDKMEGISIPQPFCQGFVPFAELMNKGLDKIPGINKLEIDAEGMKKKFGLLGEPLFLGIIVGIIIGALSCENWNEVVDKIPYILGLGIKMGAVMELIPRITSLFIEGLRPISDATRELINRKFKGAKGLNIGMSPALVIGHPTTLVVSLLLIPATLLLAVVLPGNQFLPLASLAGMFYVFPMILPITKGNVFKTFIIGFVMLLVGLLFVTNLAPFFTKAAHDVYASTGDAAVAIPDGFLGGSLDFASSPLAWIIFHLTHSLKWIGVSILILFTMFLMVLNRRAIIKLQRSDKNQESKK